MNPNGKIAGTEDAWDNRELGSDPNFAALLDTSDEVAIDDALALHPISIRLQKSLIEDFKLIAQLNGLGYQTLMRQVLTRFADCEKKRVLREAATAAATRTLERSIGAEEHPPKAASGA